MRADIHSELNKLKTYYNQKLELLNSFIIQNMACLSYLQSNNLESLEDTIFKDDSIINTINLIDFDIAEVKTKLCKKCGIDFGDFNKYFIETAKSNTETELKVLLNEINKTLTKVQDGREEIIKLLDKQMSEINKDITSLQNLRETKEQVPIIH